MLNQLWQTILVNPLLNLLVGLYKISGFSLGLSIILLTIVIRTALLPLFLPSARSMKKQQDLKPELDKIREKFKYDKQKQAEKQMEFLKQHGVNPASGCLTQIVTLLVLFALYGVIRKFTLIKDVSEINSLLYFPFLKLPSGSVNVKFWYLDLSKPDPYFLLAILSGLFQLIASRISVPYSVAGEKAAKKTPESSDDVVYNMQKQMLYTMPIMNVIVGITLPSGVVLYMLVTSIFSALQSCFLHGLGSLKTDLERMKKWIKK